MDKYDQKYKQTRIDITFATTFIGYYRIPRDTAIILETISVRHLVDHALDKSDCPFDIKRNKDGEFIIVPDVSKIDLNHSMEFMIIYKKAYREIEKYSIKSSDLPLGDASTTVVIR